VDVRVILEDGEFDRLFPEEPMWSLFCLGMTEYLCRVSGLPIDFQVQRRTEANEKFGDKPRNPIGTTDRPFAGGGDATPYYRRKIDEAMAEKEQVKGRRQLCRSTSLRMKNSGYIRVSDHHRQHVVVAVHAAEVESSRAGGISVEVDDFSGQLQRVRFHHGA
jgi:hypothetical protein